MLVKVVQVHSSLLLLLLLLVVVEVMVVLVVMEVDEKVLMVPLYFQLENRRDIVPLILFLAFLLSEIQVFE